MQFFSKSWAQIRAFFAKLSVVERMLIAALMVVMVLALYIVLNAVAKPEMVVVPLPVDRVAEARVKLQERAITVETRNGQLYVPATKQNDALGVLMSEALVSPNSAAAFDDMIAKQNPWMTDRQNQQAFLIAKQKWLGMIVAKMAGVRGADVVLSVPDDRGFGRSGVRPSASVNVMMQGGKRLDKPLVGSIASLVAGAVAGMNAQDVTVIDALAGRPYTVKSGADQWPSETMELVQQLEEYKRQQIEEVLSYIPGVIVAVNVLTDPTRSRQIEQVEFEKAEPLVSERTKESQRTQTSDQGAPGPRSNTGLDIEAGGSGQGSSERTTETENQFGPKQPIKKVSAVEVGQSVQQVNVTVNVPRSYFVMLFKQGKTDAQDPDDATLAPLVQQHLAQIQAQVEPLISATAKGVISAHMVPDRATLIAAAAGGGGSGGYLVAGGGGITGGGGGGGIGAYLNSDWIKPLGLGVMALVCLGLMMGMVRKATQAPPLPTAQELAGLPPTLPTEEDLIGEADESTPTMQGVELNELEIQHRKVAEQIAEMIKSNPIEAAQLVRRWVRTED